MENILVTGAAGQLGSELTPALRSQFGAENVIAAFHKTTPEPELAESGPLCQLDVRNLQALTETVKKYHIDSIFHLASLLSAVAEAKPQLAWDINMNGLLQVLETARKHNCSVFFPSSIAAFGPQTPSINTPQDTIQRPNTIYGISKVSGELLCDYYYSRYQVDTRGLRYPGLISSHVLPGGGTTDYAVEIFYAALKHNHYDCFLNADTRLDMMYMPDAINAAIVLMQAEPEQLRHRNAFNVTAMSFTPERLAAEIKKHLPGFSIDYKTDSVRQQIADSWPKHMDDSVATHEWGWEPKFNLTSMVKDMLAKLEVKLQNGCL